MNARATSSHSSLLMVVFLLEALLYTGLWMWNAYVASYLSLIFPAIFVLILILSAIADWIEPSRIPKWYYTLMIISILVPVCIGVFFFMINGMHLDWMDPM